MQKEVVLEALGLRPLAWDFCLVCVVLAGRGLCEVVCNYVWARNLKYEAALTRVRPVCKGEICSSRAFGVVLPDLCNLTKHLGRNWHRVVIPCITTSVVAHNF